MNRKLVLIMALTLLVGMLSVAFNVQRAKASGTIHIKANGDVDPPTAPILRQDNWYTLTADINDSIVVERDDIWIYGDDHVLDGGGTTNSGISLDSRSNVKISSVKITAFGYGILLYRSSGISVDDNDITANNDYGIMLWSSSNSSIRANTITNNRHGVDLLYSSGSNISWNDITANNVYGIDLDYSSNSSISYNTITANKGDGIGLEYSSSSSVSGNNITANTVSGIFLDNSSSSSINGNNITANGGHGISLHYSSNNSISGNNITKNSDGIYLYSLSTYNSLVGNNITNNEAGINVGGSSNNTIGGNNIANSSSGGGIGLWSSENNQILLNNITNNVNYGIGFADTSYNNKIYHNYFTGNHDSSNAIQQVRKEGSDDPQNTWDNGYPSGGNYWSDYAGADVKSGPSQDLPKGDGLGDSPYNISGNNRDRYPVFLDSDGDGIENIIELNGIDSDYDGTIDFRLPRADPQHKNLYLEIDYMGSNGTHDHKPGVDAINDVIAAFANAPVDNPDGAKGITLHIEVDEEIPHQNVINMFADFDNIKLGRFGTAAQRIDANSAKILGAKRLFYHYCLFIHQYAGDLGSSGLSELPGNDFVCSLGGFPSVNGTRDEQAGILMHEFGHNLNLRHGGGDDVNGKPNYLSIMSYSRTFPELLPNRPLDYSRAKLPDLNETNLDETVGIGGPNGNQTVYGPVTWNATENKWNVFVASSQGPIDWNTNGNPTDNRVQTSVNNFTALDYGDNILGILTGYDDWANIMYSFRGTPEFADGVHVHVDDQEITWEIVEKMRNTIMIEPLNVGFHDIAITNITPSEAAVDQGSILSISVTVANQGTYVENVSLTVYANTTSIGSQTTTLSNGSSTIISFNWNTYGFAMGDYAISAQATPVLGETDTADNTNYSTQEVAIVQESPSNNFWIWIVVIAVVITILVIAIIAITRARNKKKQPPPPPPPPIPPRP